MICNSNGLSKRQQNFLGFRTLLWSCWQGNETPEKLQNRIEIHLYWLTSFLPFRISEVTYVMLSPCYTSIFNSSLYSPLKLFLCFHPPFPSSYFPLRFSLLPFSFFMYIDFQFSSFQPFPFRFHTLYAIHFLSHPTLPPLSPLSVSANTLIWFPSSIVRSNQ